MVRRAFQVAAARVIELVLSITLVLGFFAALVLVMNLLFPSGVRIQKLVMGNAEGTEPAPNAVTGRDLRMNRDLDESQGIAVLTQTRNEVKARPAHAIAWKGAEEGLSLANRDAVQTFKRAGAVIRFDEDNHIDLGENTLLVIRQMEKSLLRDHKRSYMLMMEGELKGRFSGSGDGQMELELATPNGSARISSKDAPGGEVEFGVKINDDKSSTFTVQQGTVEVWANGEKVLVHADQYTKVGREGLTPPRPLPRPPAPLSPADGARYRFRQLTPRVGFRWSSTDDDDEYRFVLARDKNFKKVVYEEELAQAEFLYGNLTSGQYWWQVSRIQDGVEGKAGKPRSLRMVLDGAPPRLEVTFPSGPVRGSEFTLKGSTDPGVQVFVRDTEIKTAKNGLFRYTLNLEPGMNLVVVEAVDAAGNQTYRSQIVNSKQKEKENKR